MNGSAASCAGDAGQPPPTPPNPPVTDPQQQQTGSGSFTGSGVGGGITITTGTYQGTSSSSGGTGGNGGTTTPGGSSGGDGSSGGGTGTGDGDGDNGDGTTKCTAGKLCNDAYTGVPCGADPATSGDPLLAQMALEAHRSNCFRQGITDELGTADKSTGKESDLADLTDTDGGNGTVNLDSSGFLGGRGACPGFTPLEFNGYNIMNSDGICETAPMLAAFVLFAAYVAAALIAGRVISGKG
ncbi:hypothetical protein [Luteibacter sp. 22Crub2.1]|uniref:hypothetical protein n=1 Tax=Luteibacter sp. 22Crub2.1 TaxID=1283288 RepID=UPI0009A90C42|nr:hypothetical protein [Luteibacter sp. 22Crub2.1]